MTMATMPYHRRYHRDALTGYLSLPLEERGAYQTLLDMMYDAGGPIRRDLRMLAGYLQCTPRKADKLVSFLIEAGKIYVTRDGELSNRRVDRELEFAREKSKINAKNAQNQRNKKPVSPEKPKENNAVFERSLSVGETIPEPEPDIYNLELEDRERRETLPAEEPPIRRETFGHETVATKLLRSGTAPPAVDAGRGKRLIDALDHKTTPRWPVQSRFALTQ